MLKVMFMALREEIEVMMAKIEELEGERMLDLVPNQHKMNAP